MSDNFQSLGSLFDKMQDTQKDKKTTKRAPAYKWQDLALRVIQELSIPNFKRGAVFKVCKAHPEQFILQCLNDTKELCETGDKWKYFFKLIGTADNV